MLYYHSKVYGSHECFVSPMENYICVACYRALLVFDKILFADCSNNDRFYCHEMISYHANLNHE